MKNRELERKLARSLEQLAPNDPEGLLSRCAAKKGTVISMKKTTKKPWKSLIAACLALVIVGAGAGIFYAETMAVNSVISLDVNPSIELKVSRQEKVLSCEGLNQEARTVLKSMDGGEDLEGAKLNVAVNAIVGALVQEGYLEELNSAILISVEHKDGEKAAKIRQELTAAVDAVLEEKQAQAAVYSQTVQKDEKLQAQAQENNISGGKAALIQKVQSLNASLDFAALAKLSVEELKDLYKLGAPALPLGREAAAKLAFAHAGVTPARYEVDAELDDAVPHYEVEWQGQEVRVHAFTGELLQKDAPPVTGAYLGEAQALELAKADFIARYPELSGKEATRVKVELDADDAVPHYDVEFYLDNFETDYEIHAESGAILDWETDYTGKKPQAESPAAGDIGREAAVNAALQHAGLTQSQITRLEVEQDRENGRKQYEVDFKAQGFEYEYTIDAATGAVLEHEKDYDD